MLVMLEVEMVSHQRSRSLISSNGKKINRNVHIFMEANVQCSNVQGSQDVNEVLKDNGVVQICQV